MDTTWTEEPPQDGERIGIALSEWAAQGDWRLYFLHRDRIEQVRPEAVQAVAAEYLQRNNRTVGVFLPTEKAARVAIPPTPDVAALVAGYQGRAAIAEGEAFEATPENVKARVTRSELPEGIKVTLLLKKSRGAEVSLTLSLRYGDEENLKGLEPAAGFLGGLMLRGTQKLSYQQIRDELDRLTASLGSGGGGGGRRGGGRRGGGGAGGPAGTVSFSIQAKRDTLPAVLEILRQVLREPLLPADQFEIMKRERLASLEQMKTEPAVLAPRLLQRTLSPYPKDNIRYVPTIQEGIERLQAATCEQAACHPRTSASLNISAIVNPQNIAKLKKCVQDELTRLLRDGVTADELDKARQGYLQSRKVGRSSDPALAGTLAGLSHLDRTMAWEADFEKKIAALTPDQVNAALRQHIDPKKLVVIAAGDFEAKPAGIGR